MTAALENRAAAPLTRVPVAVGGWFATELDLLADDHLRVVFDDRDSSDQLVIELLPRDTPPPVLRRLDRCAVRYSGRFSAPNERRRAEIGAIVMGVATAIDERLKSGAASIADALGRDRRARRLVFSRDSLRTLLAPEMVDGQPVVDGFTLHDVYPTSHIQHAASNRLELVVEFRRSVDLRRLRFCVTKRDDERPAWLRTTHFNVVELKGASEHADAGALRSIFGFVLKLRDHPQLDVVFPDVLSDLDAPALPPAKTEERAGHALNLALDADCEQSCEFCSVKELSPAHDGGDTVLARAFTDLAAARARGVGRLRLNGYDPLAYSRVLEVIERATSLGFDRLDVFSPGTRLADRAFCEAVVARAPAQRQFTIPIYAPTAALHDSIVGSVGAFDRVHEAVENLRALVGPTAIRFLTVVTVSNVAVLPEIEAHARALAIEWSAHLPYPSYEGRGDRFFRASPRHEVVAASAAAFFAPEQRRVFPVRGVAPCVALRVLGARGVAPWQWLGLDSSPVPGTEYASAPIEHGAGDRESSAFVAATVPCRHASECALAIECGGKLLRSYVERHGLAEFEPVSMRALMEASAPERAR